MIPQIILKKNRDEAVLRFHPWIFSGAIAKINGKPNDGDDVEVFSDKGNYLASGHFYNNSIAVKIYSFERINPDKSFWKTKISNAIDHRKKLGYFQNENTNAFRLINGEGDFLPGLIVDKYDKSLVIQCHAFGMYKNRIIFSEILKDLIPDTEAIYDKSTSLLKTDGDFSDSYLFGNQSNDTILENGNKYFVDLITGQKTGFFLDQRDNRFLVSKYSKNKSILNAYCYSGGFSVAALKNGALNVDSVDVSAKAIELTNKNIELNFPSIVNHKSYVADVHNYLRECNNYDLIILDPPAFAKHHSQKSQAIKGYRNINRLAINKLNKGGVLFTFSCSQAMDNELFQSTVVSAAIEEGRQCRIIDKLHQPSDHPLNGFHPEGSYLKGLIITFD